MLDSQKYAHASGSAPESNAPDATAFAATQEFLSVSGAAWAEYHLLLGESSPQSTRIEREIRTFGGAPTIAILLARWSAESQDTSHLAIKLRLVLGRDPNARLLRRELESWAERLPNLRLDLREDLAAPEVAYRILLWPRASASTWGTPQVLQCGEIEWKYQINFQHQADELVGDEVGLAAQWWATAQRAKSLALVARHSAQCCWESKPVLERIACNLTWAEVEAESRTGTDEKI